LSYRPTRLGIDSWVRLKVYKYGLCKRNAEQTEWAHYINHYSDVLFSFLSVNYGNCRHGSQYRYMVRGRHCWCTIAYRYPVRNLNKYIVYKYPMWPFHARTEWPIVMEDETDEWFWLVRRSCDTHPVHVPAVQRVSRAQYEASSKYRTLPGSICVVEKPAE
jgi:hypothetical protein